MEGIAFSPSKNFNFNANRYSKIHGNQTLHPIQTLTQIPFRFFNHQNKPLLSFSINSTESTQTPITHPPPLVVVGSANADIYVEIDRLPAEGETISAKNGQTLAGGKGANQATCGAKLSYPTYFVGQVGDDAHGKLITQALGSGGVRLEYLKSLTGSVPTGHAVVMLQSDGQNSIIIVGGANMSSWPDKLSDQDLDVVTKAGIVLLQREIPDYVNIQVAKAAKSAGVSVIMDAGGMDAPMPQQLLNFVDIFSPNESELGRLTGMPTKNFEQISQAAGKCHKMGVKQVLVKLGAKGSALFVEGEEPIRQSIIPAAQVVDTTGAGDTFTASFAVALLEGKSKKECLRFAAAAASLCVQMKGAMPSMPNRKSVLNLLQSE
ncbi:ribokinase-like isoform X2 [Hibiscus syriacus]|uniref:ribokinase-like isoform X2 n=1 Tax=Hibiscus syriacus TaxID=106335 RepID=UPI001921AA69|nr:ribokinase-like isoform X2 [Hibiscus syriacus]